MRISGMASGFNTDEMVENLMKVERMKVDRFERTKQTALWRQESYNSMNKTFANFILNSKKDMGLTKTSSTGSMANNSYTRLDYVKKATSSNEMAATVSSTGKAVNGSYTIKVKELATNANYSSADMRVKDGSGNPSKIGTTKEWEVKEFGTELTFKLNDQDITVKGKNNKNITMDDIVNAINSTTKEEEGKKVSLGVTAFYDKENGRLFMQTTEMGKDAKINFSGVDANGVNLVSAMIPPLTGEIKGQDAEIEFNGVPLTYSSNNINLNELNIELKTKGISTTINVSTNVDGIMEKVEKLIADYNELVDQASKAVGEKVYKGFKPLTSEERKAMSESDVKLWEEKAKSGLLNRDETVERTLQSIRNDLYGTLLDKDGNKVEGFNHITQIGISTEKYSRGSMGGKLVIDKDKLRGAIEKDADGVMELLFKEPDKLPRDEAIYPKNDEGNRKYEVAERKNRKDTGGIFTKVYDNLIDGMKSIIEKSGPGQDADLLRGVKSNILIDFVTKRSSISDLDKSVTEMNRQIDNLNILLAKKEEGYYAKFTAMEKHMHKMNSQSSWLSQQFN